MISPTALTTAIAPTTSPFGNVIDAEPTPDFIGSLRSAGFGSKPPSFPTVAPAPAPTLPSATGPLVAAVAALYPQSAVGRVFGSATNGRSKITAAGTIGTTPADVLKPTLCSSR